MSIFGSIVSAIFHHGASPAATSTSAPSAQAQANSSTQAPTIQPLAPGATVDVAAVMDKLTAQSKEKDIDWRHSIVDLMKLLNLDSSLNARKELARELHYTGNMGDSATMNMWLHKQVMTKLAENGGKVPADLVH